MRRILLIALGLVFIASPCLAGGVQDAVTAVIAKKNAAAPACVCGTQHYAQETGSTLVGLYAGYVYGVAFSAAVGDSICSIELSNGLVGTAQNVEMRIGSGVNLESSYSQSKTVNVTATGWIVWTFDTPVTGQSTWYIAIMGLEAAFGDRVSFNRDTGNVATADLYTWDDDTFNMTGHVTLYDPVIRVNKCN
jgi:hypothetical protein